MLLSTHIIEDVQSVCDHLIVIYRGEALFAGTPSELIKVAEGHVGTYLEKDSASEKGVHVTSRVNTGDGIRCRIVADQLPAFALQEEPTLEDAYLYLISQGALDKKGGDR